MKSFVTIFPNFRVSHRYKDVGMIPDILGKYYDCSLLTYERNVDCGSMDGLKIKYVKRIIGNEIIDISLNLISIAKKIDILNLYHFTRKSLLFIGIYKLINWNGQVFLKLDANIENLRKIRNMSKFDKFILKRCNIISVETKYIYNELKRDLPSLKIRYIPNGTQISKKSFDKNNKKNIICTVGRLGIYEKGTEILLNAFIKVHKKIDNWELHLVGPMTKEFRQYIEKKFFEQPYLVDKIKIYGEVNDRNELFDIYNKSKIFCLPSRSESFGIAAVEAMSMGCYVIMSNIISAEDITLNGTIGSIFDIDDVTALAELMTNVCSKDEKFFNYMSEKIFDTFKNNFNYSKICRNINEYLEGENSEEDYK
ncbi:glycosyltransferase family 4 protein [Clostridium sp. SHJSY1]|uniref:glycosyltransferase family 4 protein n=1 Tax=Clostridium sp. SHJSY1 TaxID=2942483 RepID=UPI0028750A1E|nr:glycosyltransferase family 4 protein [Clostridium sp. SHJSY1]MDS0526652.1 glycosyltransferase family 4 protein [Clostridium sp. SHJSY1]